MCGDREDGYYYYTRTLDGQQYAVHARRRIPDTAGPPSGMHSGKRTELFAASLSVHSSLSNR